MLQHKFLQVSIIGNSPNFSLFPSLEKKIYIYTHIHTHRKRNKSHLTNMTHLSPLVPQSAEIAEIKIGHRRFVLSGRLSKLDKSPPFPSTTNKKKKIKEIVHNNIFVYPCTFGAKNREGDLPSKENSIPIIKWERNQRGMFSWDVSLFSPPLDKKNSGGRGKEKKKKAWKGIKRRTRERKREEEEDRIVLLYGVRRADYAIGYLAMMVETMRERRMKRQIKKDISRRGIC